MNQFDEYKIINILILKELVSGNIKFYSVVNKVWSEWLDKHTAAGEIHDWMKGHGCSISDLYVLLDNPDIEIVHVNENGYPVTRDYQMPYMSDHIYRVSYIRTGLPDELKELIPEDGRRINSRSIHNIINNH